MVTQNPRELMAQKAKERITPRQPTISFVSEMQRGYETQRPKATRSRYLKHGDGIESQRPNLFHDDLAWYCNPLFLK